MSPFQYELSNNNSNKSPVKNGDTPHPPQIIDIRKGKLDISLEDEILKGLVGRGEGEKSLPTPLLYSAEGLKLFEDITYLEEYYLTNTEIAILEKHAEDMAARVEDGSVVMELGSGRVNISMQLNQLTMS
jgi:uncharacterized SAM-dependent methyltransferase